jgi:hypothetical protein
MSLGGGLGCRVELAPLVRAMKTELPETALFAEMAGSVLVEAPANRAERIAERTGAKVIGEIMKEQVLSIRTGRMELELAVEDLAASWEKPFKEVAL